MGRNAWPGEVNSEIVEDHAEQQQSKAPRNQIENRRVFKAQGCLRIRFVSRPPRHSCFVRSGVLGSAMYHGLALSKCEGGVYQRKVAERLREVAKLPPAFRVILLCQQSQVIAG